MNYEEDSMLKRGERKMYTFEQTKDFLILLGFIQGERETETDQRLLHDLWVLVKGEQNGGVSLDTLRVVFLNMIGIRTKDREAKIEED